MAGPPEEPRGGALPPGDASAAEPGPEEIQPHCPNCGAPHDPFQEYCLECGARLTRPAAAGWSLWRREAWARDSPYWFWAAFLGLLAIALVTGAVVLAATGDDDEPDAAPTGPGTTQLTDGITTTPLPTTVDPPTATTIPTIPTGTTPTGTTSPTTTFPTTTGLPTTTRTGPTATTPTQTTPTSGGPTATWPAGRTAYTVIVGSFRESRGRGPAETRATQARNAGLDQVGILRSSDFSSLRPGWYAVFTGIFDSRSQAESRLATARNTYPTAYLRHVRP